MKYSGLFQGQLSGEEVRGLKNQIGEFFAELEPVAPTEHVRPVLGREEKTLLAQILGRVKIGQPEGDDQVVDGEVMDQRGGALLLERIDLVLIGQDEQFLGDGLLLEPGRDARVQIAQELAEDVGTGVLDLDDAGDVLLELLLVTEHGRQDGTVGRQDLSVGLQRLALNVELDVGEHLPLAQRFQVLEQRRRAPPLRQRRARIDRQTVARVDLLPHARDAHFTAAHSRRLGDDGVPVALVAFGHVVRREFVRALGADCDPLHGVLARYRARHSGRDAL